MLFGISHIAVCVSSFRIDEQQRNHTKFRNHVIVTSQSSSLNQITVYFKILHLKYSPFDSFGFFFQDYALQMM